MDYWSPKHVELLNVMNKINHQILQIWLDYKYNVAFDNCKLFFIIKQVVFVMKFKNKMFLSPLNITPLRRGGGEKV